MRKRDRLNRGAGEDDASRKKGGRIGIDLPACLLNPDRIVLFGF